MLKNILFLFFHLFLSMNLFADCQCLCSSFKTKGGTRNICAHQPSPVKDGPCKKWYQDVPNVNSQTVCVNLGEEENNCTGYYKNPSDNWVEAYDGRYHSCVFR